MNNLITLSDFKGDWSLPSQTNALFIAVYTDKITALQDAFLTDLFGYNFYSVMKKAFEDSELETNPIDLDSKWTKLIDGDDVTVDGVVYRYEGIKKALIRYCWINITEKATVSTSGNGLFVPLSENSERIDPTTNLMNKWNDLVYFMFTESICVYDYIDYIATYPSYTKTTKMKIKSWL